jgi:hypothetical protein
MNKIARRILPALAVQKHFLPMINFLKNIYGMYNGEIAGIWLTKIGIFSAGLKKTFPQTDKLR